MTQSKKKTFSERLKAWRSSKNYSQLGAAEILGVSKRSLQNYEIEHRKPTVSMAERILAVIAKDGF